MRKIIVVITIMIIVAGNAHAQTFDELFRQKKTQRKYLAQQIAALKVYLDYLKEGYKITKKGLAIVGDITGRDFTNHSKYFGSLSIVNPSLGGATIQQNISMYQDAIERNFNDLINDSKITEALTSSEIKYVRDVKANLLRECHNSASWLNTLSTNEKLVMRDDERIVEMREIVDGMKDKYVFAKFFINSARLLASQRMKEQSDLEISETLINSI